MNALERIEINELYEDNTTISGASFTIYLLAQKKSGGKYNSYLEFIELLGALNGAKIETDEFGNSTIQIMGGSALRDDNKNIFMVDVKI
jgi:hypothetical protein